MWVSTKAQYGIRAIIDVAMSGQRPTSLKTVAEKQQLSYPYLEQIFAELRRAGIVESVRGARGGYRLAKPADRVTALDVIERLEGSIAPVVCIDDEDSCDRTGRCGSEDLWRDVDTAVRQVLRGVTLADLMAKRELIDLEPLPQRFIEAR